MDDAKISIKISALSCPGGSGQENGAGGKCSHVAALLVYIQKNISCTDVPCQWSSKKKAADSVTQSKKSSLLNTSYILHRYWVKFNDVYFSRRQHGRFHSNL